MIAPDRVVWGCGRFPRVKDRGDGALRPTKSCKRVWECPCCNAASLHPRRTELLWRLCAAEEIGSEVLLVTLTMSHRQGDDLEPLMQVLEKAYNDLFNAGSRGNALRRALGFWKTDRTLQVSWGNQGFHPHYHLLVFLNPGAPATDVSHVSDALTSAWHQVLLDAAIHFERPSVLPMDAVDVRRVFEPHGMAKYLTMPPLMPDPDDQTRFLATGMFVALAERGSHDDSCRCRRCCQWYARWRDYTQTMLGRRRFTSWGLDRELERAGASPRPATAMSTDVSDR